MNNVGPHACVVSTEYSSSRYSMALHANLNVLVQMLIRPERALVRILELVQNFFIQELDLEGVVFQKI